MTHPAPHEPNAAQGKRAVVVGAGPNGLTAAAVLAVNGWAVEVLERNAHPGGAAASGPVLGDGTIVDLGAAGHPFGIASPVFRDLDLGRWGLRWVHGDHAMAHPLEDRPAALLDADPEATAQRLGRDARRWLRWHAPVAGHIDQHLANVLRPVLGVPPHPLRLLQFGPRALPSASAVAHGLLRTTEAQSLFLGSAAHAIAPLHHPFTGAFGLLFGALGMSRGWPVAQGGTGAVTGALAELIRAHGGTIRLEHEVTDLRELPAADAVLLDLPPRRILDLGGLDRSAMPPLMRWGMRSWRHGAAAHKVDYLLDGPVPWTDPEVSGATTVHVVGGPDELIRAEAEVARGRLPERPFVMLCQQQAADPLRATGPAAGRTVVWAYAHVPAAWRDDPAGEVRRRIEAQIERFAPGFRDRVVRAVETGPQALEAWNPNLIGGDVAGGAMTGLQALLRPAPALNPYRLGPSGPAVPGRSEGTPLYLASSSAPPGAGVHGMPGALAARTVLADVR